MTLISHICLAQKFEKACDLQAAVSPWLNLGSLVVIHGMSQETWHRRSKQEANCSVPDQSQCLAISFGRRWLEQQWPTCLSVKISGIGTWLHILVYIYLAPRYSGRSHIDSIPLGTYAHILHIYIYTVSPRPAISTTYRYTDITPIYLWSPMSLPKSDKWSI